jgi:alkylhydroperoxidase family enzyme
MRFTLPDGENPVVYSTRRLGSPVLVEARNAAFQTAYINDSTLTPREREMIRMRSVYQASCSLCSQTRAARDVKGYSDEPIPEELYDHILDWRTWPGYTDRERLGIEFCERYMLDYMDMVYDEDLWTRLHANFTETEIGDLCLLVGLWDASTKQFHLLVGLDGSCEIPVRGLAAADQSA